MKKATKEQIAAVSKLNGEAAVLECQLAAKNYAINKIISAATQIDTATGVEDEADGRIDAFGH